MNKSNRLVIVLVILISINIGLNYTLGGFKEVTISLITMILAIALATQLASWIKSGRDEDEYDR